jgi:hypothetical protein
MPRLSFFQLTKIFAAGFLGYAAILAILSVGTALLFPSFVKSRLDMSIHTFYESIFYFFGFLGGVSTFLMLIGAWCVLRLFRHGVSPNDPAARQRRSMPYE